MNKFFALCLVACMGCTDSDAAEKYTILVFSSENCAPCRQYEPVVRQLQAEGWPIRLYKDEHGLAQQYGVSAYPTTCVVDPRGRVVWSHVGYISLDQARVYLNKYRKHLQ